MELAHGAATGNLVEASMITFAPPTVITSGRRPGVKFSASTALAPLVATTATPSATIARTKSSKMLMPAMSPRCTDIFVAVTATAGPSPRRARAAVTARRSR